MPKPRTAPTPSAVQQLSMDFINEQTPMGARLLPNKTGATFRVWAPRARELKLCWDYRETEPGNWQPQHEGKMSKFDGEFWGGFVPGIKAGTTYMFHVTGPENGTIGPKRDPYARELTCNPAWPNCLCLLDDPGVFTWHDSNWKPPMFHELIIYQLHVGTWFTPKGESRDGTFLDIIEHLPYLKSLGVNAIQPLPISEFPTTDSLGYNYVDPFSTENDYSISNAGLLNDHLLTINYLMTQADPNFKPYSQEDITGSVNQFRMMVDMCHIFGIAVILDVVYNHGAGDGCGDENIYFFDRLPRGNNNDSLYFTDRGFVGGLVFAYWNNNVRQFLIDNAKYFITECHADGYRFDEVSTIKNYGGEYGWKFCRDVTDTCRFIKPEAINIAESWPVEQAIVSSTAEGGAGFDAMQNDGFRDAVRSAVAQASAGAGAFVDMAGIGREIASPVLRDSWRAVQCTENHDIVKVGEKPRIACLADGSDSRSWYARSRSRVAFGLTLTAAGIPHIFMGQEFLEDKQWNDVPGGSHRIWWDGLQKDRSMNDFNRFARELLWIRRSFPGLHGSGLNVFHVHNDNRVIAFHRWEPGKGQDVVVVASFNESTWWDYALGMPSGGYWREVFNSDVYDNWVNPVVAGNGGGFDAWGGPMHNLPASGHIVIPANGLLIFSR